MIKYEIFDSLVSGKTNMAREEDSLVCILIDDKVVIVESLIAESIIKRKYNNNDVKYTPYERLFV